MYRAYDGEAKKEDGSVRRMNRRGCRAGSTQVDRVQETGPREESRNKTEQSCPGRRKSAGNHRVVGWMADQLGLSFPFRCSGGVVLLSMLRCLLRCCNVAEVQWCNARCSMLDLVHNLGISQTGWSRSSERRCSRRLCLSGKAPPQLGG